MQTPRPTFIGIGAQKAGTSWMCQQLARHGDAWVPPIKEIHYFDRSPDYHSSNRLAEASPARRLLGSGRWERPAMLTDMRMIARLVRDRRFDRARWWVHWTFGRYDDDWYRGLFDPAADRRACGEFTPSYSILDDHGVAGIRSLNPAMKILYLIRNPIERAWSAIRFNVANGFASFSLDAPDEIIAALKLPKMIVRGDYERTLATYLRHFSPPQILVCHYDAISRDPVGLMADITDFLGIDRFVSEQIDHRTRVNPSPVLDMHPLVSEYLHETYDPMIRRLAEAYGGYAGRWAGGEPADDKGPAPAPTFHP